MISSSDTNPQNFVSSDRLDLMEKGLKELSKWISDVVSNGISTLIQGADEPWESLAVRMVDYKLGGIAGYLRKMSNREEDQGLEEWHFEAIKLIAYLQALISGFQKARFQGKIPAFDILRACGVNFKRDDIKKIQSGISDCWRVIYMEQDSNDYVEYIKLYLLGIKTNLLALILDFKGRDSRGELPWYLIRRDVYFEAELFYYPSAFPVRGFLEKIKPIDFPTISPIRKSSNPDFLTAFAQQPFAFSFPVVLFPCQIHHLDAKNICWNDTQLPCHMMEEASIELTEDLLNQQVVVLAEWTGWTLKILRIIKD